MSPNFPTNSATRDSPNVAPVRNAFPGDLIFGIDFLALSMMVCCAVAWIACLTHFARASDPCKGSVSADHNV